jgi:hypothetical protein
MTTITIITTGGTIIITITTIITGGTITTIITTMTGIDRWPEPVASSPERHRLTYLGEGESQDLVQNRRRELAHYCA